MISFVKKYPDFREGAYGVVFFDSNGRATKVFRRRLDADRLHVEKVCDSEIQAYILASATEFLRDLIPAFYGQVAVQCITDENGDDISSDFYLDLAYQMERIEGEFEKISGLSNGLIEVRKQFKVAGISHISDASVLLLDGRISKVIDFATVEYELFH